MYRFIIFFAFLPACIPIEPVIKKYNLMRAEEIKKHKDVVDEIGKKQQEGLTEVRGIYKKLYYVLDENGKVKDPICQWPKFIELMSECQAQKNNFDCMSTLSRTYVEMLQERYFKASNVTTRAVAVGLSGDLAQLETDLAKAHNEQVRTEEEKSFRKINDLFTEYLIKIANNHREIMVSINQMEFAEIESIRQQNARTAKAISDGINQANEDMRRQREQQQQQNINIYYDNQMRYCTKSGNNVFCH